LPVPAIPGVPLNHPGTNEGNPVIESNPVI
jgi:hypothetical protein